MRTFVPGLAGRKSQILAAVEPTIKAVIPLVGAPQDTFTIDFALTEDLSEALLIEVNDPPPTAGTSLFLWDAEEDRKILAEGPLTVRILDAIAPWSEHTDLHPPLKEYIDELRDRKVVEEKQKAVVSAEEDPQESSEETRDSVCVIS